MTPNPKLYIFSGAGLSAESGIPTFRGNDGTWANVDVNEVCNILTWKKNRDKVFDFYANRRREYKDTRPNAAHIQLAQWQQRWGPERVVLLTQNVDGLLEKAGAPRVVHLHGNMGDLHCTACGLQWPVELDAYHAHTRCPRCDSLKGVKPGVVFFQEEAPEYAHLMAMRKSIRGQDIVIVVGSAMNVISIEKMLPSQRLGHPLTWQVNPVPAEPHHYGRVLAMGASEGIAQLHPDVQATMDAGR